MVDALVDEAEKIMAEGIEARHRGGRRGRGGDRGGDARRAAADPGRRRQPLRRTRRAHSRDDREAVADACAGRRDRSDARPHADSRRARVSSSGWSGWAPPAWCSAPRCRTGSNGRRRRSSQGPHRLCRCCRSGASASTRSPAASRIATRQRVHSCTVDGPRRTTVHADRTHELTAMPPTRLTQRLPVRHRLAGARRALDRRAARRRCSTAPA